MLLKAAPFVELHPLLNRRDWSPARISQSGNELRRGNKRVARTDAGHRLGSEDRWSQDAKLLVGQFDAFMDGDEIIILSEHIWPFVHGFVSGRAATGGSRLNLEARALAAVSGVKEDRSAARISLSAADAGHRRHIIALVLIALAQQPWRPFGPVNYGR